MNSFDKKIIYTADYIEEKFNYKFYIFLIILIYIFIELFVLSKFAYNYDHNYNYGTNINKLCKMKYYEYETPRYQIVSNYNNLIINVDKYNNVFLYFIYMFFGIFLSLMFIYYIIIINNEYYISNIIKYILIIIVLFTVPSLVRIDNPDINRLVIVITFLLFSLYFKSDNFDVINIIITYLLFIIYLFIINKCKIAYTKYEDDIIKMNFYEKYSSDNIYSPIANLMKFDINFTSRFKTQIDYVFIFLMVLLLLSIMPISKDYIENRVNKLIYNMLIIVCLIIFLISKTINLNTEINKIMIYEPLKHYKTNLNEVNKAFYFIINKDKSEIVNKSVCRNIANLILIVLYSKIFTNHINIYDSISLIGEKDSYINKYKINIDPEFIYLSECYHDNIFDYTKEKSYDINYYLNNKNNNESIFYHSIDKKCKNINVDILKLVIINITKQINTNSTITIKDYINKAVSQYLDLFNYNNDDNKEFNILKIPELKENISLPENENFPEYLTELIDNVVVEYNNFEDKVKNHVIRNLKLICACEGIEFYNIEQNIDNIGNITDSDNIEQNNTKESIKNKLIKLISEEFTSSFDKINLLFSNIDDTRKKNTLSKFIINNYNNIHIDDKYNRSSLKVFKITDEELISKFNNIIIKGITDIDKNLNSLIDKFNNFFSSIDNGKWTNGKDITNENYIVMFSEDVKYIYSNIIRINDDDLLKIKNIIIEYNKKYDENIKSCYSKNIRDSIAIIDNKSQFVKSIIILELEDKLKDKYFEKYTEFFNNNYIIPNIEDICKKELKSNIALKEYNKDSIMNIYIVFIQYICTLLLLK